MLKFLKNLFNFYSLNFLEVSKDTAEKFYEPAPNIVLSEQAIDIISSTWEQVDDILAQWSVLYYYDKSDKSLNLRLHNPGKYSQDIDSFRRELIQTINLLREGWEEVQKVNFWSYLIKHISRIASDNMPLLDINRIWIWDRIYNIMFFWVKEINDSLWKDLVDEFIAFFKSKVWKNVDSYNCWVKEDLKVSKLSKWSRVRSSYKNMTFSIPKKKGNQDVDPYEVLFWNKSSQKRGDYIESLYNEMMDKMAENRKKQLLRWKDEGKARAVFLENFSFWIWFSSDWWDLDEGKVTLKDKLNRFNRAEKSSKRDESDSLNEASEYNEESVMLAIKEAVFIYDLLAWEIKEENIEEMSSKEWLSDEEKKMYESLKELIESLPEPKSLKWLFFSFKGSSIKIPIVSNRKISRIFLSQIRKWKDLDIYKKKENGSEEEYENMSDFFVHIRVSMEYFIETLNSSLDFIAPYVDDKQLDEVPEIEKSMQWEASDWKINKRSIETKYLDRNYKWTMTKEALEENMRWKQGHMVFIDIVDMWVMNLEDFLEKWRLLIEWYLDQEEKNQLFRTTWNTVTNNFINLVNYLKDYLDTDLISLWWDEVMIFIEDESKAKDDIMKTIASVLGQNSLKWRVSYHKKQVDEDVLSFWDLDSRTSLNKLLELQLAKHFQEYEMPYMTNIDFSDQVSIDNFSEFYIGFSNAIWSLDVEKIGQLKDDWNIAIDIWWDISAKIKMRYIQETTWEESKGGWVKKTWDFIDIDIILN